MNDITKHRITPMPNIINRKSVILSLEGENDRTRHFLHRKQVEDFIETTKTAEMNKMKQMETKNMLQKTNVTKNKLITTPQLSHFFMTKTSAPKGFVSNGENTWETEWKNVKKYFNESIKKADLAEVKMITTPTPAIEIVLGVFIEILYQKEENITWKETRKCLRNIDQCYAKMENLTLDETLSSAITRNLTIVTNDAFDTIKIHFINQNVAKLAYWILSVVRAYCTKYNMPMKTIETSLPDLAEKNEMQKTDVMVINKKASIINGGGKKNIKPLSMSPLLETTISQGSVIKPLNSVVENSGPTTYMCKDGQNSIYYEILKGEGTSTISLLFFHDIFDTFEMDSVLCTSLISKFPSLQCVLFNLPGQANTSFDSAMGLDGLIQCIKDFFNSIKERLSDRVITIGYGFGYYVFMKVLMSHEMDFNIEKCVSINGTYAIDDTSAEILRNCMEMCNHIPKNRTDMVSSFFLKYLFSNEYLQAIGEGLALQIYSSIKNPISMNGRIMLCQIILESLHTTMETPTLKDFPLIVLHGLDDTLIKTSNVDSIVTGRNITNFWIRQASDMINVKSKIEGASTNEKGALMIWLKAGHEIRQEAKKHLLDIMESIVHSTRGCKERGSESSPVNIPVNVPPLRQQETQSQVLNAENGDNRMTADSIDLSTLADTAVPEINQRMLNQNERQRSEENQIGNNEEKLVKSLKVTEARRSIEIAPNMRQSKSFFHEKTPEPPSIDALPRISVPLLVDRPKHSSSSPTYDPVTPSLLSSGALSNTPSLLSPGALDVASPVSSGSAGSVSFLSPSAVNTPSSLFTPGTMSATLLTSNVLKTSSSENKNCTESFLKKIREEQETRRKLWEQENKARHEEMERMLRSGMTEIQTAIDTQEKRRRSRSFTTSNLHPLLDGSHVSYTNFFEKKYQSLFGVKETGNEDTVSAVAKQLRRIGSESSCLAPLAVTEAPAPAEEKKSFLLQDYEEVKSQISESLWDAQRRLENEEKEKLLRKQDQSACQIQRIVRGFLGRCIVAKEKQKELDKKNRKNAGALIVRIARGKLGRLKAKHQRELLRKNQVEHDSAIMIQKIGRGYIARKNYIHEVRKTNSIEIQRVFRGYKDRKKVKAARKSILIEKQRRESVTKIQSQWREYSARSKYMALKLRSLASIEIQRVFRGYHDRKIVRRKREWRNAKPGAERIALGLKLVEESKATFEKHQNEIDNLHYAQEHAEDKIRDLNKVLKQSEKDLLHIEKELETASEKDAEELELCKLLNETKRASVDKGNNKEEERRISEIEMAIGIKRKEKDEKQKALEAEFQTMGKIVKKKKAELEVLTAKLNDMEALNESKKKEFRTMQRDLMELLEEQKNELSLLKEKGVELETATATSAVAAALTAVKAKEHHEKSQAMFHSTEELMKFQFMSMSLSYFSSLNMLKGLRDINADTTTAALASTAESAATAAIAANAANIPQNPNDKYGNYTDLVNFINKRKQAEEEQKKEEERVREAKANPLPAEITAWTLDDVGRWLDTLSLTQYKSNFHEGRVDGELLSELEEKDLIELLNVSHPLHVKKILLNRDKALYGKSPMNKPSELMLSSPSIKSLSYQSSNRSLQSEKSVTKSIASSVQRFTEKNIQPVAEEGDGDLKLDIETVISQVRNNRFQRLQQSITQGFPINSEDENGNTLLIIACQNLNRKVAEYLISKNADVNHQNKQGNTALHYAMLYDTEGTLGEFLIEHGADDSVTNAAGLSPYDGIE